MVSKEEIERVAKLMRIEIDDHVVHVDRVQKMIEYFDRFYIHLEYPLK